jgi:hypothetical protein
VSVERICVVQPIAEAFVDALVDEPAFWADRIGPLVDERHRDDVHARAGCVLSRLPVGTVKITTKVVHWSPP